MYVLENSLPIDTEYYLTNQLSKPLSRLFEPIIDNPSALLHGEHTRSIVKKTPTARAGGIMMFAVKKLKVGPNQRKKCPCYNSNSLPPSLIIQSKHWHIAFFAFKKNDSTQLLE